MLSRLVRRETLLTCSKLRIVCRISAIRSCGSVDCAIRVRYFVSMSLHSMPRGADPLGAALITAAHVAFMGMANAAVQQSGGEAQ